MKHKVKFLKAVAYGLAMKTHILDLKFLYKKILSYNNTMIIKKQTDWAAFYMKL